MSRRPSSARVPKTEQVEQKEAYDTFVKPLAGAPEYTDDLLIYARYKPYPNEDWAGYKARIDMSMASADAALDVRRAVWEQGKFQTPEYEAGSDSDAAADVVNIAVARADPLWSPEVINELAKDVFTRLATVLPSTNCAPPDIVEADKADYIWATARCVFAGAGYAAHADITRTLMDKFTTCPFVIDESRELWERNLDDAHQACGIPASLTWARWHDLRSLPHIEIGAMVPFWLFWRAWVHVLTHVRREQLDAYIRISYRGMTRLEVFTNSNKLADWQNKQLILANLGCPVQTSKKKIHPLTRAVGLVLSQLAVEWLLPVQPLTALPAYVLWGRWSTFEPVAWRPGFADHGLQLTGVWAAMDGKIEPADGSDDDIISYAWNMTDPRSKENREDRQRFEDGLPSTYDIAWPADTLLAEFTNLDTSHHKDPLAWKSVLDHVIFASLMRNECDFSREFPLVCALPTQPLAETSTNQGKSLFAHTIARAMLPATEIVKSVDSSSAPDMRACAEKIRASGTVCLDEWYPPINKGHLLSRDNLQTLCTGGSVLAGRVMENTATGIKLAHSITLSSKALDFAPDLVNRSLFWFLDKLSPTQLANAEAIERLEHGVTGLVMRLGALAYLEKYNLTTLFNTLSKPGGVYRFKGHRALASILYGIRCTEAGVVPDTDAIDKVIGEMRSRHATHTADADEFGTLASLESGKELKLRISNLFHDLTGKDLDHIRTWMAAHTDSPGSSRGSPTKLLRGWLSLRDSADAPLSTAVQYMTGRTTKVSDRLVSNLLAEEIRAWLVSGSAKVIPGVSGEAGGWILKRHNDRGRNMSVSLERIEKLATGEMRIEDVKVED